MSKVIVGLLITILGLCSRIFKWDILEKDVQTLAEIIVEIAGLVIAWYGRKKTTGTEVSWLGVYKKTIPLVVLFSLSGCALIAPKPEDLSAIRATNEALPVLLQKSEDIYTKSIEALVVELRKRAYAEVNQAQDYELLKVTVDGAVPADKVLEIAAQAMELRRQADVAIENLRSTALNHEVHQQLHVVVGLLHDYLLARATDDEQRAAIAQQAHDLIYRKK